VALPCFAWSAYCIAHEVESTDGEAAGFISKDMIFLEADDVDLFLLCDGTECACLGSIGSLEYG